MSRSRPTKRPAFGTLAALALDATVLPLVAYQGLLAGGLLLICSRASGASGEKACNAAVDGAYTLLEGLARRGIGAVAAMPRKADVRRRAKGQREARRSPRVGKEDLRNFWYVDTSAADRGLVLLIQWGSGSQFDDDFLQPAAEILAETIHQVAPVAIFASEIRGWARAAFELYPVVRAIKRLGAGRGAPVYIGFAAGERPFEPMSGELERYLFNEGLKAREDAEDIRRRTRVHMIDKTDTGKVSGLIRYGLSSPLPTPLTAFRLATGEHRGEQRVCWDRPADRPALAEVVYGLSYVRLPDGTLAPGTDQYDLHVWWYDHYLTRGWDEQATARHLVAHRFTSMALRRDYGDDAAYRLREPAEPGEPGEDSWDGGDGGDGEAGEAGEAGEDGGDGEDGEAVAVDGAATTPAAAPTGPSGKEPRELTARQLNDKIWRYRDFHRKGDLDLLVDGRLLPWQVAFPGGQPIATREQIDRIAEARRRVRPDRAAARACGVSGTSLLLDGERVVLALAPGAPVRFSYLYPATEPGPPSHGRHVPTAALRYATIAEIFIRAVTPPEGADLVPLPRTREHLIQLQDKVTVTRAALAEATTRRDHYGRQLDQQELKGAALRRQGDQYDRAQREVTDRTTEVEKAQRALDAAERADAAGIRASEVFAYAAAVRDPFDTRFVPLLAAAIRDGTVTSTRIRGPDDLRATFLDVSLDFVLLDDAGRPWLASGAGRQVTGSLTRLLDRLRAVIAGMRAGVPADVTWGNGYGQWYPHLRAALGHPPRAAALVLRIPDPRLLRLTMATCYPAAADQPALFTGSRPEDVPVLVAPPLTAAQRASLAAELGEPVTLLDKIADLHAGPGLRIAAYLRPTVGRLPAAIAAARSTGLAPADLPPTTTTPDGFEVFEVVRGRARVLACPRCGSRDRKLSRLRLVTGLLCNRCHRDQAGHLWPADPYDRYDLYDAQPPR